jgi:4-amino-4-deoxy-L-arabinose transferase-like glycosyltransferase
MRCNFQFVHQPPSIRWLEATIGKNSWSLEMENYSMKNLPPSLLKNWRILTLFLLAALVLLWGLKRGSLEDFDEAIYAQISKEIVEDGNWLTLHWGYKPYLEKPPVFMWSTAILFHLFGVNEFWARAASAFSGIGLAIITYFIGQFVYDKQIGYWAGLILLTSNQFVASARFGTTDIMLTLFIFLAVYAYLRLEEGTQKWWYIIGIACALAFMVKSVAALIAPLAIALSLFLDKCLITSIRSRHFWQGALLAFVMVVPWHIFMYLQHGQAFVDQYFGYSIITRAAGSLEGHTGDRFYYIDRLQKYFFPWVYLAPFALALNLRENIKFKSRSRILLIVTILVFGLYTVAQTKLRWYIVPMYPALVILVASMVMQGFRSYTSVAFGSLVVATFIVTLLAPIKIVLIVGGASLLIGLSALVITKRLPYQLTAIVMCTFLIMVGLNTLRPIYSKGEMPVAKIARFAGTQNPNGQQPLIVFEGLYQPTPLFYSDRPIQVAWTLQTLAEFTSIYQTKEIILAKKDLKSLSTAYEIEMVTEVKPFVYATIKPKASPLQK